MRIYWDNTTSQAQAGDLTLRWNTTPGQWREQTLAFSLGPNVTPRPWDVQVFDIRGGLNVTVRLENGSIYAESWDRWTSAGLVVNIEPGGVFFGYVKT